MGIYPCLRAITATALLVKATEKIMGSLLTIFVPHAVEALLISHHSQHFSASCLISYKGLLLTVPHITLLLHNNLNLATSLHITDEVPYDSLTLTNYLLTPCDDLQEIPLGNVDFSWPTDGSYLKVTMVNIVLEMLLQILWMLLRNHLYILLLQHNRLNYTVFYELIF